MLTKTKIKEECEDNGDFNCNEETQKIHQEINCEVDDSIENADKSDENSMALETSGVLTCWNLAQNPEDVDAIIDEDLLDPFSLIP